MARNGSGTYARASSSYTYNTIIDQVEVNAELDDIATALTNSLTKNGETTATANQPMGTYRHTGVGNGVARTDYAAMGQLQDGTANWIDGGGTADAITATYAPAITALVDGQICCVRATAANATTTPTFAPNGLTARTIVRGGGSALVAGDIAAVGHELILRYNLANTRWEWLNAPPLNIAGNAATATTATTATTADSLGGVSSSLYALKSNLAPVTNLLPNCNFQMFTSNVHGTLQTSDGTAARTGISFTSFTATNGTPTFLTTNTQGIVVGEMVYIDGLTTLSTSAHRIQGVVNNTSFIIQMPLGLLSPASAAGTAYPLGIGDTAGNTTGAASSGWNKTVTVVNWADDYATNKCIGAKRVMGFRKGSASQESFYHDMTTFSATDITKYKGRQMTFGALVRQKVQGGAGTWKLTISDGVGVTDSGAGTGSGYSDATYGGYEFLSVTRTIDAAATTINCILYLDGATSDVYYLASPTLVEGNLLTREQCGQNHQELLHTVQHWNPPTITPLVATFPAIAHAGTGGLLFGFDGTECDLEPMSYGQMHKSVKAIKTKIEFTSPTAGKMIFTGSNLTGAVLNFGPQVVTQVGTVLNVDSGWWPLHTDGTGAIFTAAASTVITNATFDFDEVQL